MVIDIIYWEKKKSGVKLSHYGTQELGIVREVANINSGRIEANRLKWEDKEEVIVKGQTDVEIELAFK